VGAVNTSRPFPLSKAKGSFASGWRTEANEPFTRSYDGAALAVKLNLFNTAPARRSSK
jgi:hypothetical protein